jgi:hypothetical protein
MIVLVPDIVRGLSPTKRNRKYEVTEYAEFGSIELFVAGMAGHLPSYHLLNPYGAMLGEIFAFSGISGESADDLVVFLDRVTSARLFQSATNTGKACRRGFITLFS